MTTPEFITKLVNLTISTATTELFVVFRDGDNFMIEATDKIYGDIDIIYSHKTADVVSFKKKVHDELDDKHVEGDKYKCTEVELLQAIIVAINNEVHDRQVKMVREMAAIIDSEECRRFIGETSGAASLVLTILRDMIKADKIKFSWDDDKFVAAIHLLDQVNMYMVQPIDMDELDSIMDKFATPETKRFGSVTMPGYRFK